MFGSGRVAGGAAALIVALGLAGLKGWARYSANERRQEQRAVDRKQAQRDQVNRYRESMNQRMDQYSVPHRTTRPPMIQTPRININPPTPPSNPRPVVNPRPTPVQPPNPVVQVQPEPADITVPPGTVSLPGNPPRHLPAPDSSPVVPTPEVKPRRELVLEHSPVPVDASLEPYAFWTLAEGYDAYLDEPIQINGFSVRSSIEFRLKRQNAREAEWDAPRGTRGVGLGMRVDQLLPRDIGLTSSVLNDEEGRQVFRLGRRQERTRGGATITYLDHHGLLIWKIMVPASENSQLATCYYTAVAEDKMVVLTARYDKDKPEQLNGFDAIACTLTYSP